MFGHIINPVIVNESSDLFLAQPITFESMRIAKAFSKATVDVHLLSAQFPEDRRLVPHDFEITPDLDQSILDIAAFAQRRRLPLLNDVLDRLYEAATDAHYLIYTNADIALMPNFYSAVNRIAELGYDAFVINRRTISKQYTDLDDLHIMFSQVGKKHPGYDCFVFKRTLYPYFNLGKACIGANWIGKVLISNLICYAQEFHVFEDLHLTFHIGDDRSWKNPIYNDYDSYNRKQLHDILMQYESQGLLQGKPLVHGFMRHIENRDVQGPSRLSSLRTKLKNYVRRTIS